jgi:DNA-damage-inducible protein D
MVGIGSGTERTIDDFNLSRYACYLIVQNADPRKGVVALGQTYFATQTRKQEIIESFENLDEDSKRVAIRNELKEHNKKGLKKSQEILDHMGSTELAANLFRATQTEEKLIRENIKGKENANKTHLEVGSKVRQTIKELGGTMPEDLATPDKSIKQIERKNKKIIGN